MKHLTNKLFYLLTLACAIIVLSACHEVPTATVTEESVVPTETTMLNVSAVEGWCRGDDVGITRMIGAWMVQDDEGLITLEDEAGNLWEVADVAISEDDFLLLWIADNNTPEDLTDDLIVKCWAEVH